MKNRNEIGRRQDRVHEDLSKYQATFGHGSKADTSHDDRVPQGEWFD